MGKDDIIATSPTVPASESTLAHRIVIRDLGDKFVVHMQVFEGVRHYFNTGHYYLKSNAAPSVAESDHEALQKAWDRFVERSRNILRFEPKRK